MSFYIRITPIKKIMEVNELLTRVDRWLEGITEKARSYQAEIQKALKTPGSSGNKAPEPSSHGSCVLRNNSLQSLAAASPPAKSSSKRSATDLNWFEEKADEATKAFLFQSWVVFVFGAFLHFSSVHVSTGRLQ